LSRPIQHVKSRLLFAILGIVHSLGGCAGADGVLAVAISGVLMGGKPVVEVIKAWAKQSRRELEEQPRVDY
jgi:hypothetical protein